jgi:hypothetical protein
LYPLGIGGIEIDDDDDDDDDKLCLYHLKTFIMSGRNKYNLIQT